LQIVLNANIFANQLFVSADLVINCSLMIKVVLKMGNLSSLFAATIF